MKKTMTFVLCILLMAGVAMTASAEGVECSGDSCTLSVYKMNYEVKTQKSFEGERAEVTGAAENVIWIQAWFPDGGGINSHSLAVTVAEKKAEETVLDVVLTVDGMPGKALFGGEMQASVIPPDPGTYRVRVWLVEKFHGSAAKWLGEAIVTLPAQ